MLTIQDFFEAIEHLNLKPDQDLPIIFTIQCKGDDEDTISYYEDCHIQIRRKEVDPEHIEIIVSKG